MAKYKDNKQETFLFRSMIKYWRNLVTNYDGHCFDDDYFAIMKNYFDHDSAVELIRAAYGVDELREMENAKSRRERLDLSDDLDDVFSALWNNEESREKCRAVIDAACEYMEEDCPQPKDDISQTRLSELARLMKLDEVETDILELAYVRWTSCFCWPFSLEMRQIPTFYAMATDRSVEEVRVAMGPHGRLMKFNLLDRDYDFSRFTLGSFMSGASDDAVCRKFYDKVTDGDILPWEYFGELAQGDGEVLKRMLRAGGGKCNILLYGAPGTGKTSFAKSLAREVGRTVFEIRQGTRDGEQMNSGSRMVGIQICNTQESPETDVMVIDEADTLLCSCDGRHEGPGTEKGVVNTLLDDMRMPAIWIANTPPEEMDESVRRRFDYSILFESLSGTQREAIWRNQISRHGLGTLIPEGKVVDYAARYETSAGGISTVLANVKRMAPSPEDVDALVATLMKPHCRLMGVKDSAEFLPARDYSLDGLSIKGAIRLDRIVKAARNFLDDRFNAAADDRPRMNILLFGPPGTGKTEFVKYLGKTLGRKVKVVKGSDLLHPYVGMTERLIARAFRQAEADHSILFFDEIDGLLQDRSGAFHSWEVTHVNEFLQQMENFNGVMVAATNFSKNLDPATMRRFTFKLEFGYLDDDGKRRFFERFFKATLSDEEMQCLAAVRNLTPGDFRTVRQELFYLGGDATNADRIAALKDECARKKEERPQGRVGFN